MKKALSIILALSLIIGVWCFPVSALNYSDGTFKLPLEETKPTKTSKSSESTALKNIMDDSIYQLFADVYLDKSDSFENVPSITNLKQKLDFYIEHDGFIQVQNDYNQQDKNLMRRIAEWETLTFYDDIGSSATGAEITTRYEVILLELLKRVLKEDSYIKELERSIQAESVAPAALLELFLKAQGYDKAPESITPDVIEGFFTKVVDLCDEVKLGIDTGKTAGEIFAVNGLADLFGDVDLQLTEETVNLFKHKQAYKKMLTAGEILKWTGWGIEQITDCVNAVNTYMLCSELNSIGDGYTAFLDVLINNCNANENLKKAAANVKDAISSNWNSNMYALSGFVIKKVEVGIQKVWNACVDVIAKAYPALGATFLLYETSIEIINFSLGTDDKIESVYVAQAFAEIYVAVQKGTSWCMANYLSNENDETAELFVASVNLLYTTVIADCDYIIDYLNTIENTGVISSIWNDLTGVSDDLESYRQFANEKKANRISAFDVFKFCTTFALTEAIKAENISSDILDNIANELEEEEAVYIPLLNENLQGYVASGAWGTLNWTLDSEGLLVISGVGSMDGFSSSSTSAWRAYKDKITKVSIRFGVTSIGSCAFYACSSLASVTISDSITSIGSDAFYDAAYYNDKSNWNNEVLYIGNHLIKANANLSGNYAIKNGTLTIANYAFENCSILEEIIIPDSVLSVSYSAFSNCKSLVNVTIGNNVAEIGDHAFEGCSSIAQVFIPDSVTSIYGSAFKNCTSLIDINIPNGITYVGDSAFSNCNSLEAINVPDSVTYFGKFVFNSCDSLKSVVIGNSVTSVRNNAFSSCKNLESVTIGNAVTTIEKSAFESCCSLKHINIPDSVTYIGDNAFSIGDNTIGIGDNGLTFVTETSSLKSIDIPNSVTYIGNSAFENCNSLESVTLGNSIKAIGAGVFENCSSLKIINIPDSVTSIGNRAFYDCTSLTNVTIGNGVASIGDFAFYNCTSLTNVTIGNSITSIGDSAFEYCRSLVSITIDNDNNYYCTENGVLFNKEKTQLICYPVNKPDSDYAIPSTVKHISDYVFFDCNYLQNVSIPASVVSIGDYAFHYASIINITVESTNSHYSSEDGVLFNKDRTKLICYPTGKVNAMYIVPDSVTSIGNKAFYMTCPEVIIIPDGVTSIGDQAFYASPYLETICIPNSVDTVGSNAFYNCHSLETIYYTGSENEWNEIKENLPDRNIVFNYDYNNPFSYEQYDNGIHITSCAKIALGNIVIPNTINGLPVVSINDYAFHNCAYITSITVPNSVTSIGDSAFFGCHSLTSINIPNGVISISDYAFGCCDSLTSISIPDSVTSIGDGAFECCSFLTSISIPNSVTSIGLSTFASCSALTSISIPDGVTSIGSYAFWYCDSLTSISIPDSVTYIGNRAFEYCTSIDSVYYLGTEKQWNSITIDTDNKPLLNANITFGEEDEVVVETTYTVTVTDNGDGTVTVTATVPADIDGGKIVVSVSEDLTLIPDSLRSEVEGSTLNPYYNRDGISGACIAFAYNVVYEEGAVVFIADYTVAEGASVDLSDVTVPIWDLYSNGIRVGTQNDGDVIKIFEISDDVSGEESSGDDASGDDVVDTDLSGTNIVLGKEYTTQTSFDGVDWGEPYYNGAFDDGYALGESLGCFTDGVVRDVDQLVEGGAGVAGKTVELTGTYNTHCITFELDKFYDINGLVLGTARRSYNRYTNLKDIQVLKNGEWQSVDFTEKAVAIEGAGQYADESRGVAPHDQFFNITAYFTSEKVNGVKVFLDTEDKTGLISYYGPRAYLVQLDEISVYGAESEDQTVVSYVVASDHPYANSANQTWSLETEEDAVAMAITFGANTYVESGYDYIYIYDGNGELVGKYTGNELASKTITVMSANASICLTSDGSGTYYGFAITSIDYYRSMDDIPNIGGTWGNISWTLYGESTLAISGNGAIENFGYESTSAWLAYKDSIKNVIISNGVTSIDDFAFSDCHALTSASIPGSVTSIGASAFRGCTGLNKVYYQSFFTKWSSLYTSTLPEGAVVITKGDLDLDYSITATDYLITKEFIKGSSELSDDASFSADVTNDGVITTADLLSLRFQIASEE